MKKHLLKSALSLVLSVAMVAILVVTPFLGVSATENPDTVKVYQSYDCWNAAHVFKDVEVTQGKTYTFSLLWRDIWSKATTVISVGGTTVLSGLYEAQNGAIYDPYTGRVSYTFTADSSSVRIDLDNLGDNKYHCYKFADPKMYESTSAGVAVESGEVIDCDASFESWLTRNLNDQPVPDGDFSIIDGSVEDFPTRHHQPESGKVYAVVTGNNWDEYTNYFDASVISGKTYTFSILWQAGDGDSTHLSVGGIQILAGGYNTQNGAYFNPYEGRIYYTFTASSDTVNINFENRGSDIKHKSYVIADPKLYESDANGVAVAGGVTSDCDVDFCSWNHAGWGAPSPLGYTSIVDASMFPTKTAPHAQPESGKVYVYRAGGFGEEKWGNNNLYKSIAVIPGKTYTFTALWKAESNDHTQFIVDGTKIINGYYRVQNGATYNPYTGRVSYTFTTSNSSVLVNLENCGNDIQEKNYYFADPKLFESDANGVAVANGDVADCDVDFCVDKWNMTINWAAANNWERSIYVSVGDASDFVMAEKSEISYDAPEEGGDIWAFSYASGWNRRQTSNEIYAIAGKRYTFEMYWKDLGNCKSVVMVNGTRILEGGYNTVNGAKFDPATGKLTYTFIAGSTIIPICIDNMYDGDEFNKNYSFAYPRMYEVDANGNAVAGGDEADCDADFNKFYDGGWKIIDQSYNVTDVTDGAQIVAVNSSDFSLRTNHPQTTQEGKVYAVSQRYDYDSKYISYSPFVYSGKTYTFSILYKVFGTTTTRITVDGTRILNGDYNTENGAKFDPYTGILSYTFTASSDKVTIAFDNLDNGGGNAEKYHSYDIAEPKLIETDAEGVAVENGDVADCDVDFCGWSITNYNGTYNIQDSIITVDKADFVLRTTPHTQPDNSIYVLSYSWNMWTKSSLCKEVFVLKGRTYTFTMLWKDYTNTTFINIDGTTVLDGTELKNGATYDLQTGIFKYTFTPSSSTVSIVLNNEDESKKNHFYSIANPLMFESDANGNAVAGGDVADCDVDFCSWYTVYGTNKVPNEFTVDLSDETGFMYDVVFGDVNNDTVCDLKDLVAAKKELAGKYTGTFNYMSLGYKSSTKSIVADDLVFIRQLLLGNLNCRTKAELSSLLGQLHNADGYAIGVNLAGSSMVTKAVEAFESKTGEKPAYVDFDMCCVPYLTDSSLNYSVSQLARYCRDGGFVALTSHWLVPTKKVVESSNNGANNSRYQLTSTQYAQVYTAGNELYDNFRAELAMEAEFIATLKQYGINVVYRPLHECNEGSFWWCSNAKGGVTPQMVANLYDYVYNYFTVECGLDNILWQFNIDASDTANNMVSPSNVDILGIDCYTHNGYTHGIADDYYNLSQICGDKVFAIAEFFTDDETGYEDLSAALTSFTNDLTYKFAYLGIYCNVGDLTPFELPSNAITLSSTASLCR